jgi:hypothetical protein
MESDLKNMYIIEFGRGPDKRKRKRRNLLRNAASVGAGAALGAGAISGGLAVNNRRGKKR